MKQTFGKKERLRSPQIIGRLFKRGSEEVHTFYLFPFRVLYIYDTQAPVSQVVFSISKKNFKRAVDRNVLRRRCKEAYRLQKASLSSLPAENRPAYIAFLFLAKEITSYDVIEAAMKQSLKRLEKLPSGRLKTPNS